MSAKLFLIATLIGASSFVFSPSPVQARGPQNWNRNRGNFGQATRVYNYRSYGRPVYSNNAYGIQSYSPYARYSSNYGNYRSFGYPSGYGYGRNFNNYGYRPNSGVTFSFGNSGFGNYRGFGF